MKAIFKGNKFVIQWAITDAVTSLPFDFTGMFVDFVLYSDNYHGRISGYTLSGNKMQAEIPANMLPVGVYNIVCEYRTRKENHGHCICRRAFQITRNPEFCTGDDTVTIESFAAPLQLDHMDINYIGHYPSGVSLPDQDRPAWALVGTLKEAKPWFFYTPGSVPPGFQAGWNDMSDVLGTYDLTADKVSIYDFHLLTEYNVSRNHSHTSKVFSTDWSIMRLYFREFSDYAHGQTYPACSKVNMPGYNEHSFMANKPTSEAPFKVVEDTNEFTFAEAVDLVPQEYRFAGMRVTFINSMTHQAETWFFKGGTWGNVGNWQKIDFGVGEDQLTAEEAFREKFEPMQLTADRAIADEHGNRIPDTYVTRQAVANYIKSIYQDLFITYPPNIMEGYITPEMLSEAVKDMLAASGATITNLPDEEDLSTVHGVLKFANKRYNPGAYSGLGRQYLRKNQVAGANVLTQSMMQWPDTIYIIQYDYQLQGETINIPSGCVLKFEGGSIEGGTIATDDVTLVEGNPVLPEVTLQGTFQRIEDGTCLTKVIFI